MNKTENKYSKLDYKAIGKKISELRGERNQTDFAKDFGVKQVDISRLETGTFKKPDMELLYNICLRYGKSITWLFTEEREGEDKGIIPFQTPEEREYIDKFIEVLRNPNTRKAIIENIDTFLKVPKPAAEKKRREE